jgi:hopanoid biosynthesis associated RND transporter like protein HpnN
MPIAPSFSTMVARLTAFCVRAAWSVILLVAVLSTAAGILAVQRFSITTDTNRLMPSALPWVQRQHAYEAQFPPRQLVAVIHAPTPELVQDAATRVQEQLARAGGAIASTEQPQGGAFLARTGLLYPPRAELERSTAGLVQARPILAALAADPTLRGIFQVAAQTARSDPGRAGRPCAMLADMLDAIFAGKFGSFSWQALLRGHDPAPADLRQMLLIQPKQDFSALRPASRAQAAIRAAADRAGIALRDGATVAVTGQAAINDDQFSTLSRGAALNGLGTAVAVLLILWLALRSGRIVLAVVLNLLAGLAITAAAGLLMVGAFNLISVAFAVLFVGLGADFGIQFAVRYRAEHHDTPSIPEALGAAAAKAGGALALAAAGVTAGFFSFLPTDYRGIAELGQTAGVGMIVAFLLTLTLLPALLAVLRSRGEPERLGYAFLAPVDKALARHRKAVVIGTLAVVLAGSPLLARLRFDFNPMHLQDPAGEAVRTYRALGRDPGTGVAAVDLAAPSLAEARALAKRLDALPSVYGTRTIDALIPSDQDAKLAVIARAAATLLPALQPRQASPPPSRAETLAAIRGLAAALPVGAEEDRLRPLLRRLEGADSSTLARVSDAMVMPLRLDLAALAAALRPERVTVADLPADLRRDWLMPDGHARVQILPRADPDDTPAMAGFARAVLAVAPGASGTAITLLESGRTVVRAFIQAGGFAVSSIAVILYIALRKLRDVALTLVPLLVAAGVTLEVTVLIGQQMNFANIIALPLLLGVGVAFKIYYVLAWRRGATGLLQSALTRAVFFSALTTMTAFGSLWLSNDPGMSSMGKLMAIALLCTLMAAVLFQPALMGPPRAQARGD